MKHQSNRFFDYFPPAPQLPTPPDTYLYTLYCYFLVIHSNDLRILLKFPRRGIKLQIDTKVRGIKLQIDTKVNVLGLVEVRYLKYVKHMKKKKNVNHETTPPYLRDQFTTCALMGSGSGRNLHIFCAPFVLESNHILCR